MIITLNTPKLVTLQPAKTKTISTITVTRVVDLPQQKIVKAFIQELPDAIILWEGEAYDSIGQWTDVNVSARITEIYSA